MRARLRCGRDPEASATPVRARPRCGRDPGGGRVPGAGATPMQLAKDFIYGDWQMKEGWAPLSFEPRRGFKGTARLLIAMSVNTGSI